MRSRSINSKHPGLPLAIFVLALALIPAVVFGASRAARSDGGPRKYLDEPDAWFSSPVAAEIAANVLSHQSDLGGWPKNTDTTAKPFAGDRSKLHGTFDNNATMDELRLLARFYAVTKDNRYRAAIEKGVDHILKAQYPTGGWPQSYPPDKSYHRYITFNDGAMVRVMELLREVATSDRFAFLDETRKKSAQSAFDRGIDCILKCQINVNGKLTAWCAQHDEKDYSPREGRKFELASLSGSESVGITELLMSLDNPAPQVVSAVQAACAWFESAKIIGIRVDEPKEDAAPKGHDRVVVQDPSAPPMWARFYDIKTNRPLYADRDSIPKDALADLSYERRNGYRWIYYWPQPLLEKEYPDWKIKWAARIPATAP